MRRIELGTIVEPPERRCRCACCCSTTATRRGVGRHTD